MLDSALRPPPELPELKVLTPSRGILLRGVCGLGVTIGLLAGGWAVAAWRAGDEPARVGVPVRAALPAVSQPPHSPTLAKLPEFTQPRREPPAQVEPAPEAPSRAQEEIPVEVETTAAPVEAPVATAPPAAAPPVLAKPQIVDGETRTK
jgi:hypothetical protein